MKIVAISGSMNPESTTRQAVQIVMNAAIDAGAEAELIHLGDWKLPIYDCRKDESTYPEVVHRFRDRIRNADGLILGSPQYHGSLSGCLKNALDFIGSKELEGKFVALVGTSGGALGATNTLNTLNEICRNLHAWPLPSAPSVPQSYAAFLPDGTLKEPQLQKRLEAQGRQLVSVMKSCSERLPAEG